MQRWWFNDDDKSKDVHVEVASIDRSAERRHTFRVLANHSLQPWEVIAVSGACSNLGNWQLERSVKLHREIDSNIWSGVVAIPKNRDIPYRYFACTVDPNTGHTHVRHWETHLTPRKISAYHDDITGGSSEHASSENANTANGSSGNDSSSGSSSSGIDTFGDINGEERIDRGWLSTETVLQFKFIRNPFTLKQKLKNKLLFVKLTPMNLRINAPESSHNNAAHLEDSLSNDTRENGSIELPVYAFAEVVTLGHENSAFEPQSQFGRPYNKDDIILINVMVGDPENVAYLIDLYTYSSRTSSIDDEPPYHLGYHYILPNLLQKSDGQIEIPITCAQRHRPLGMMNLEYIKITPLASSVPLTLEQSFCRYWNRKWTGLEVGHRGSGTSFKQAVVSDTTIRENTIASLKRAAEHGADMVEFDVQLSKDLIPVIYHDFLVYVSLKRKKSIDENDMLELPMSELTLEQLKHLKVYHIVEGKTRQAKFFDEHLDEHQPFPPLTDALEAIDESVGFNIEIKWNQKLIDGTMEIDRINKNRNLYLDTILEVVLSKAGKRRIVFSCFDPDICTMLRMKQNLYPVMFLTIGVTERYAKYYDPRCGTIATSAYNASANELLGIVAHSEDLLRDSSQMKLASDLGLIVFCWGDDNNSPDTIRYMKTLGIHGIIYDKMDMLSTKKKSIFYVEAKDPQKDILRLQQLETKWHEEAPSHVAAAAAAAANAAMAAADLNVSESISIAGLTTGTSTESLTGNGNTMANTI